MLAGDAEALDCTDRYRASQGGRNTNAMAETNVTPRKRRTRNAKRIKLGQSMVAEEMTRL